jgi:membrane protein
VSRRAWRCTRWRAAARSDLTRLRRLLGATRAGLAGRDLALASAGASLYAALALVPSLLVAIAVGQVFLGRDGMARYGRQVAENMPAALGADDWTADLVAAGLSLSVVGVVLAVFMGTAYGEGLSRALRRFAPADERDRPPAWWTRAATLPVLGMAPLLLAASFLTAPLFARLSQGNGWAGVAAASYLSLNVVWVVSWLPLTWVFRVVAPGRPAWRAAFGGAVVTGAFVSGFLQGFLLFLALPVDLGRPFGGLDLVGIVSGLLLWLWVLHIVVCVGYAFTWALDGDVGQDDGPHAGDAG